LVFAERAIFKLCELHQFLVILYGRRKRAKLTVIVWFDKTVPPKVSLTKVNTLSEKFLAGSPIGRETEHSDRKLSHSGKLTPFLIW